MKCPKLMAKLTVNSTFGSVKTNLSNVQSVISDLIKSGAEYITIEVHQSNNEQPIDHSDDPDAYKSELA